MKSFVTIIGLMLISCAGLAQTSASITPGYPYNCEEHKKLIEPVTRVLNVKSYETVDTLDVEFDTELLLCKQATYIPQDISKYTSFTFFDETHLLSQYQPFYAVSPSEFSINHVTLQFDKARLFKKNKEVEQVTFSYKMETPAARAYNPRIDGFWDYEKLGRIYPWYIHMTYVQETATTKVEISSQK